MINYIKAKFAEKNIKSEKGKGIDANNDPIICPDEVVAIVELTKDKCIFSDDFFDIDKRKESNYKKDFKTILLILESPHIEEYSFPNNRAHPASGWTGKMIRDHFLNNLFKAANVIDNNEYGVYKQCPNQIPFQSYRLLVANAVPFQCSLGEKLSSKENHKRKEEILAYCLSTFENEIIGRIKEYNPDIVINCCTKQNKQKVQSIIHKTFPYSIYLSGSHPSSAFFTKGFTIIRRLEQS